MPFLSESPEPGNGLSRSARIVLIVLAVLIVGAGICSAIAFLSNA